MSQAIQCPNPTILELLPEEFKQDNLVSGASDIFAHLISQIEQDAQQNLDIHKYLRAVLKGSKYSDSGLMNWFNYYKPYMGTDTFINFMLKLTKIDSKIIPWYESNNPINTFDLTLDEYPSTVDIESFINLINTYKNIESKLASIRMEDCPTRFVLDHSLLDEDILSDTKGIEIGGTNFCFRTTRKYRFYDPKYTTKTSYLITATRSDRFKAVDYMILDDTIMNELSVDVKVVKGNLRGYKTSLRQTWMGRYSSGYIWDDEYHVYGSEPKFTRETI